MRKFCIMLAYVFSFSCFAAASNPHATSCGKAVSVDDPSFCQSFTTVAICQCTESSHSPAGCQTMKDIYKKTTDAFHHSIEDACDYGDRVLHLTSKQDCLDDWHCYWSGGTASGKTCSSTGLQCDSL